MRDNFYAVNMGQDQWDQIFGKKKEVKPDTSGAVCQCGHDRDWHNDLYSDGIKNGHFTECRMCNCQEFKIPGPDNRDLLELIVQAQRDIAKAVSIPKEVMEKMNENN
jgi:hypothetical protein